MRYLHTMLRVRNLDAALKFYQDALGLKEVRRVDNDKAKFTLVFLCAPEDEGLLKASQGTAARRWSSSPIIGTRRNTARTAISATSPTRSTTSTRPATRLMKMGITINRPPRDGQMAFVRSPDLHSIELLQKGDAEAAGGAVDLDAEHRPLVRPLEPGMYKFFVHRRHPAYRLVISGCVREDSKSSLPGSTGNPSASQDLKVMDTRVKPAYDN